MALRKFWLLLFTAGLMISCRPAPVANQVAGMPKQERIALLIRDLDKVDAKQWMTPGYITFGESPEVKALIQEGEDAVDPLIDCVESDPRMTQTKDESPITGKSRTVGVEEPAFAALQGILHCHDQFPSLKEPYSNYGPGNGVLERRELAAKIRDYWNKYRGKSQPERWYEILQDDQATSEAWAEAAGNIVLPDSQDLFPGYGVMMMSRLQKPGAPVVFWGEILRGKTNPTVSELLVKRLKDAQARPYATSPFPLQPIKELAAAVAQWDGKNQVETLRWYSAGLEKIVAGQVANNGPEQVHDLIQTYLERIESGDPQAMGDYAKWIRAADARKLNELAHLYGATFFAPLWSYPQDPLMIETANWLFQDTKSPWSLGPADPDPTWTSHSARIPLVGLPVFRAMVLKQLGETRVIGQTEVDSPNSVLMTFHTAPGSGWRVDDAPPVGTKIDLRLCDSIAFSVSEIHGAPAFEPYWSLARRDAAVKEIAQFLERYGDRLIRRTHSSATYDPFITEQLLAFAPLDHPATQADVNAGLAIFSMEGKGERKLVPLATFPAHGQWTRLKSPTADANGTIWQAEDVQVAGKWVRYYGFVSQHGMAAVPAEEMELSSY